MRTRISNEWLNSVRNEKNDKIKDLNVSETKWINLLAAHTPNYMYYYEQHSNVQFTLEVWAALLNDKLNIWVFSIFSTTYEQSGKKWCKI